MTSSAAGAASRTPRDFMDCQEARISLGVYVLGAIEPAERALVDSHLATCRNCRDELAGLAGLPALLARVSTEEAVALAAVNGTAVREAPRELLGTVLDLTAARQRRRRWREAALGVAAALVIAVGVVGGVRLAAGPAPAGSSASAPFPGPANGAWETASAQSGSMSAAVTYRSMGWGVQLAAQVAGIPMRTHCELWVISATGQRILAGSWLTDDNEGKVWYPASAALAVKDLAGFQVIVGQHEEIAIDA